MVWEGYQRVKADKGAAGVDGVTIEQLEQNLSTRSLSHGSPCGPPAVTRRTTRPEPPTVRCSASTRPGDVESQTAYDYDGLGRVTTERFLVGGGAGREKWRTTTTYSGDRVTVDPPTGATPTTTISDARGNATEVRQYKAGSSTGDFDATKYTYTPAGKPATATDAAGDKWTHTYDLRGREIQTDDPDKGTTTTSYDDLDQVTSTQDARGKKLFFTYDPIGRKTEERQDSTTGTLLTSWLYDTVRKGQLTSVTRNIGGASYVETNNAYDNLNQPPRTTYAVPSVTGEEKLAGSYQYNTRYNLDCRGKIRSALAADIHLRATSGRLRSGRRRYVQTIPADGRRAAPVRIGRVPDASQLSCNAQIPWQLAWSCEAWFALSISLSITALFHRKGQPWRRSMGWTVPIDQRPRRSSATSTVCHRDD